MKYLIPFILLLALSNCGDLQAPPLQSQSQEEESTAHQEPTHNFSVMRLMILNADNEVLMEKEEGNWYSPSFIYNKRQFIKEALDSLAHAYGVEIVNPKLHGYFSYKYEYHPYATLRSFYIAQYSKGEIMVSPPQEDVKWMPIEEAINKTPVKSMKEIMDQILNHQDTLWGGSFEIYRIGEEHQSRIVEDFYPLF